MRDRTDKTKDHMRKIITIHSPAVLVPTANIDTDQIIPARFLKTTSREGFGKKLFYDWRYDADGRLIRDNVIDSQLSGPASGQGCSILVAGDNFGCGSSREHAAWAIADAGFMAVVSSSFADIFRNNALNNSLLPVQVSADYLASLMAAIAADPALIVSVDLPSQTIYADGAGEERFRINGYKKECLMKGYSDIDYLLAHKDRILEYEESHL